VAEDGGGAETKGHTILRSRERGSKPAPDRPAGVVGRSFPLTAGEIALAPTPSDWERLFGELAQYGEGFSDVRGQEMAKRALTVAGGGGP